MSRKPVACVVLCVGLSFVVARLAADDEANSSPEIPAEKSAKRLPDTPGLVVGKKVPDFWTINPGGQGYGLKDPWIRKRYALLEFWSLAAGDRQADQARMESLRKEFLGEDRLLILSICVDQDTEEWMDYVRAQKDLTRRDGSRVGFHTDNRWWQLQLGANDAEKEVPAFIEKFGLAKLPQFFLVRPGEILAARHIPADQLKDVVAAELKKGAQ